jgi:hypothetical protein
LLVSATATAAPEPGEKDACASAAEQSELSRRAHKLIDAREALLFCAREVCPRVVRADCLQWLGEVDAALPSIILRVVDDAGHEVPSAQVLVDGAKSAAPIGRDTVALDPGEHILLIEAPGFNSAETRVVLHDGEQRHLLSITLHTAPATPKDGRVERTAAAPATSEAAAGASSEVATPGHIAPAAWIVGGAGVAAAGVGVAFWLFGLNDHHNLIDRCGRPGTCSSNDIDDSKRSGMTKFVIGDVLFGAGIAALGAAVWIGLSSKRAIKVNVARAFGGAEISCATRF